MVLLIRIILLLIGTLALAGAVLFMTRGFEARSSVGREAYNVARMNARRVMMRNSYVALALLVISGIFFAAGFLYTGGDEAAAEAVPTPTQSIPTIPGDQTPEPSPTAPVVEALPSPTEPATPEQPETPSTPTPPPTVTSEPTPERVRAIVNSPVVGLYLRTAPNGEIIERLEDQAELFLLGEEQLVGGLRWVRVGDLSGREGWVAAEFLLIGDQIPPPTLAPVEPAVEGTPTAASGG